MTDDSDNDNDNDTSGIEIPVTAIARSRIYDALDRSMYSHEQLYQTISNRDVFETVSFTDEQVQLLDEISTDIECDKHGWTIQQKYIDNAMRQLSSRSQSVSDGGVLTLQGYQNATVQTAIYPREQIDFIPTDTHQRVPGFDTEQHRTAFIEELYLTLGLTGEAGEVAEKFKKYLREGDENYRADAIDELGDCLWYLARLADELDVSLDEVAQRNLDKLADRDDRDAIEGEGDTR